jgi:hypothetical protein
MPVLYSLPFMLPTLYMIQVISLFGVPTSGDPNCYLSDLD